MASIEELGYQLIGFLLFEYDAREYIEGSFILFCINSLRKLIGVWF